MTEHFPVVRAFDLKAEQQPQRFLIEGLWGAQATGILAGTPKTCKSWLGLEMAVSVATGTPCLGRFQVSASGRVLIYLAEDSLPSIRERLQSLVGYRGLPLTDLDVHVITVPKMRLDIERDRCRLVETARAITPRLLLLDPLVRLHALNENSAEEISPLLSFLRDLQRELEMAVVTVHHTRKSGSGTGQAGLGLRGTGDLWAFGDSNLYLRRRGDRLELSIEHRFASAPEPIALRLVDDRLEAVHLEVVTNTAGDSGAGLAALCDQIVAVLRTSPPMSRGHLRSVLRVKNQRLGEALLVLEGSETIKRTPAGWSLVNPWLGDRSRSPADAYDNAVEGTGDFADDLPF